MLLVAFIIINSYHIVEYLLTPVDTVLEEQYVPGPKPPHTCFDSTDKLIIDHSVCDGSCSCDGMGCD